jgi:hypothetical protein
MSKIRTLSDLQAEMSTEFVWRKRELHDLKAMVNANEKSRLRDLCVRAAVPLLYAHWEGFVKRIGDAYLEFVALQRLKNDELASPFLASVIGQLVRAVAASSKIQPCLHVVSFFRSHAKARSRIKWKSAIRTKANLNSAVFREIVMTLGLDYTPFATKEKLIDEKLLSNRNSIAHGRYSLVDFAEYMNLHGEVLVMMQAFYDQVENAAVMQSYRLHSTA